MKTPEEKIEALEQLIKQQSRNLSALNKRITFLERENNRRRSELQQLSQKKNG